MQLSKFLENYLTLKKIGSNYFSLCPFHYEKTPSFAINDKKSFFFCFGCGISGDKLTFLSLFSKKVQLTKLDNSCYDISSIFFLEKVKLFFINSLFCTENVFVFKYICFFRKITLWSILFFDLGYASSSWYSLLNFLDCFDRTLAVEIGLLCKDNKNFYYDFFRHAIVFPLKHINGSVVGFTGRNFFKRSAKYINLVNSSFFVKNNFFYGLFESLLLFRNCDYVLIVEGFFDVIRIIQDVNVACVATLGVAFSRKLFFSLLNFTKKIFFCFDGDLTGLRAHFSVINKHLFFLFRKKLFVFFLLLPFKHDPDTYVLQNGKICFLLKIKFSYTLYTFFFSYLIFFNVLFKILKLYLRKIFSESCKKIHIILHLFNDYYYNTIDASNDYNIQSVNLHDYGLFLKKILCYLTTVRVYVYFFNDYFFFRYLFYNNKLYFFLREVIFLLRCNYKLSLTKLYRRLCFFPKYFSFLLRFYNFFFNFNFFFILFKKNRCNFN